MTQKTNAVVDATATSFKLKPAVGVLMQLDPNAVVLSELASRAPFNLKDKDDIALRDSIKATGGNVTPGLVLRRANPEKPDETMDVVLTGQRSLEVCQQLGLLFNATVIDEVSFLEMAQYMSLSNTARKARSARESGRFYRKCLESGHFASQSKLAEFLVVPPSDMSNALYLDSLPVVVIAAFGSEDQLRYRDAKPLKDALKTDEKRVLAAAKRLAKRQGSLVNKIAADDVMDELTGWNLSPATTARPAEVPVPSETLVVAGSPPDQASIGELAELIESNSSSQATAPADAETREAPSYDPLDAEEIPSSSSQASLRDQAHTKASIIVRPSKAWPIVLDGVGCGTVSILETGSFQMYLDFGVGLTARHGPAMAQHIADFLDGRAFGADADGED